MNDAQRQALIDLLARTRYRNIADLIDGPLAPVIEALAATVAWDTVSLELPIEYLDAVSQRFTEALNALDPAWLGEP